jgi:glycosyltransferase involved in cell wall biosynthesis
LAQTQANFEVLVVDDGSTDGDGSLALSSLGVNYIQQPRRGVSAARNNGARQAQGRWLAFLDSDDEWLPGKLSAQMADLEKQPDLMVSQCQEIWYRGQTRVNPGRKHQKKAGDIFLESLGLCLISPSAVIIRTDLFWELGGFDEELLACEDYDLWLRLTARYPVGLLDQALVIRRAGRPDQLSAGWGLDRYRIKALKKILNSGLLDPERAQAAALELERRSRIYENGRLKRGLELEEI